MTASGMTTASATTDELEAGGCAYWAALDGSLVRLRTPWYLASQDGVIFGMKLRTGPTGTYFDDVPHWEVALAYDSGVKMEFGHVGRIADDVALAVLAATGCDPRNWESCTGVGPGTDLLLGAPPIPISSGDPVAQPQVFADEVPGYAGYRVGGGSFPEYPWAQMEFNVSAVVQGELVNACVFGLVNSDRRDAYRVVMEADMVDPSSQKYRPRFDLRDWTWQAECALCNSPWQGGYDFSSLFTNLGGWYRADRRGDGFRRDRRLRTDRHGDRAVQPVGVPTRHRHPDHPTAGLYRRTLSRGPCRTVRSSRFSIPPESSWNGPRRVCSSSGGTSVGPVATSTRPQPTDSMRTASRSSGARLPRARGAAQAAAPTLDPTEPCTESTVICYNHNEQPGY